MIYMMMYGVYVVIYVLYMMHDLRRRQLELLASKAPSRAAELMPQTGCEKKSWAHVGPGAHASQRLGRSAMFLQ